MSPLLIMISVCTTSTFKHRLHPEQMWLGGWLTKMHYSTAVFRTQGSLLCIPVTTTSCLSEGKDVHGLMARRQHVPFKNVPRDKEKAFLHFLFVLFCLFLKTDLSQIIFVLKVEFQIDQKLHVSIKKRNKKATLFSTGSSWMEQCEEKKTFASIIHRMPVMSSYILTFHL